MKEYADGKIRDDIDKIKALENLYGIDKLSPFGTNHTKIFEEIVEAKDGRKTDSPDERNRLTLAKLNRLAHKCGAIVSADLREQKAFLWEAFKAYQRENPSSYGQHKGRSLKLDMRKNDNKEVLKKLDAARTKSVFEKDFSTETPESFRKLLNTYTLSDLQHLAAKAGFNPTFDRGRVIKTLVREFTEDKKNRPNL